HRIFRTSESKANARNHSLQHIRPMEDGVSFITKKRVKSTRDKYKGVERQLNKSADYKPVSIESYAPVSSAHRPWWYQNMGFENYSVALYSKNYGNNVPAHHFLWKLPEKEEERSETATSAAILRCSKDLLKFNTREIMSNAKKLVRA
ncbi:hypothetical protein SARC_15282, partial [Sphaeroforma arctica JP610]